jgi:hypothetical protein
MQLQLSGKKTPRPRPLHRPDRQSHWVARAALAVATLALLVSFRSSQISREAYDLGLRQYREERQLVLIGEFTKDGDAVKLKSANDAITFMEGSATFPTLISKKNGPFVLAIRPCIW